MINISDINIEKKREYLIDVLGFSKIHVEEYDEKRIDYIIVDNQKVQELRNFIK